MGFLEGNEASLPQQSFFQSERFDLGLTHLPRSPEDEDTSAHAEIQNQQHSLQTEAAVRDGIHSESQSHLCIPDPDLASSCSPASSSLYGVTSHESSPTSSATFKALAIDLSGDDNNSHSWRQLKAFEDGIDEEKDPVSKKVSATRTHKPEIVPRFCGRILHANVLHPVGVTKTSVNSRSRQQNFDLQSHKPRDTPHYRGHARLVRSSSVPTGRQSAFTYHQPVFTLCVHNTPLVTSSRLEKQRGWDNSRKSRSWTKHFPSSVITNPRSKNTSPPVFSPTNVYVPEGSSFLFPTLCTLSKCIAHIASASGLSSGSQLIQSLDLKERFRLSKIEGDNFTKPIKTASHLEAANSIRLSSATSVRFVHRTTTHSVLQVSQQGSAHKFEDHHDKFPNFRLTSFNSFNSFNSFKDTRHLPKRSLSISDLNQVRHLKMTSLLPFNQQYAEKPEHVQISQETFFSQSMVSPGFFGSFMASCSQGTGLEPCDHPVEAEQGHKIPEFADKGLSDGPTTDIVIDSISLFHSAAVNPDLSSEPVQASSDGSTEHAGEAHISCAFEDYNFMSPTTPFFPDSPSHKNHITTQSASMKGTISPTSVLLIRNPSTYGSGGRWETVVHDSLERNKLLKAKLAINNWEKKYREVVKKNEALEIKLVQPTVAESKYFTAVEQNKSLKSQLVDARNLKQEYRKAIQENKFLKAQISAIKSRPPTAEQRQDQQGALIDKFTYAVDSPFKESAALGVCNQINFAHTDHLGSQQLASSPAQVSRSPPESAEKKARIDMAKQVHRDNMRIMKELARKYGEGSPQFRDHVSNLKTATGRQSKIGKRKRKVDLESGLQYLLHGAPEAQTNSIQRAVKATQGQGLKYLGGTEADASTAQVQTAGCPNPGAASSAKLYDPFSDEIPDHPGL